MDYQLKVLSIYELGQRKNQEDYIYPPIGSVTDKERFFIVCDGMGGHENGEVASKTVCEKMAEYLSENYNSEDVFTENIFNAALSYAYDALDALDDGAVKKMGTTLTFLMFHNDGCFLAHIGDSRIYHVRPSENGADRILYVTRDHSLVNDLVAIGEMTPEEAKTSRQKNVITRAIQPNQERRSKADIYNIEDIRPGDYFYMCSDGMLEQAEDMEIANVISMKKKTDEEKLEMFRRLTEDNKDNHSAHLIKIVSIGGGESCVQEYNTEEKNYVRFIAIFTVVLAVMACWYLFFRNESNKTVKDNSNTEIKNDVKPPVATHTEYRASDATEVPSNSFESVPEEYSPAPSSDSGECLDEGDDTADLQEIQEAAMRQQMPGDLVNMATRQ